MAPLVPFFLLFVLTHVFAIVYAFCLRGDQLGTLTHQAVADVGQLRGQLGTAYRVPGDLRLKGFVIVFSTARFARQFAGVMDGLLFRQRSLNRA